MSDAVVERRTGRAILRRLFRIEVAAGQSLTRIQVLGAGFFAVGPLLTLIAALATAPEPPMAAIWEWVLLAFAFVILCFVAIFMGASVLGGVSANAARRARALLDVEDATTGGDWQTELSMRSYYQTQVRFGQTLFGWLTLLGFVVAPFAVLGLWMEAGQP